MTLSCKDLLHISDYWNSKTDLKQFLCIQSKTFGWILLPTCCLLHKCSGKKCYLFKMCSRLHFPDGLHEGISYYDADVSSRVPICFAGQLSQVHLCQTVRRVTQMQAENGGPCRLLRQRDVDALLKPAEIKYRAADLIWVFATVLWLVHWEMATNASLILILDTWSFFKWNIVVQYIITIQIYIQYWQYIPKAQIQIGYKMLLTR